MDSRDKLFNQIIDQVYSGESIMCCFPRRSGKTQLIVDMLNDPLQDDDVVVIVPSRIYGESLQERCRRKIQYKTYKQINSLKGRDNIDCVIFEEPSLFIKPEDFDKAMNLVQALRCQVIFVFTPFRDDPFNSHPLKRLWDTAPYYKYQLNPSGFDWYEKALDNRDTWTETDFQTEVDGNWVAGSE